MAATIKNTTPAVETATVTPSDLIKAAHADVKVEGKDRARALRTAAEVAIIAAYGPFTITETVSLPEGQSFRAWISGAAGRNGFKVTGKMGTAVMGKTTIEAMIGHDAKSFTNAEAFKIGAPASKRGTVVMSGLIG